MEERLYTTQTDQSAFLDGRIHCRLPAFSNLYTNAFAIGAFIFCVAKKVKLFTVLSLHGAPFSGSYKIRFDQATCPQGQEVTLFTSVV